MKPRKKQPVTTGGAGYISDADLRSAVKNAGYKDLFGNLPVDTIRKRLYDGVTPVGYYDPIGRIKEALAGKKYSDNIYYWEIRDPIWAEYLLIPEEYRHDSHYSGLRLSNFRPKVGDDPSVVYYMYPNSYGGRTISDRTADKLIKSANGMKFSQDLTDGYKYQIDDSTYLKFGQSKVDAPLSTAFGAHTVSRDVDPNRGEYISYYDLWDLSPLKTHGSDESMGIGKPVHFYDRLYLDDYYNVDSSARPGTYYGGYLPEVTIMPRKK